MNNEDNQNNKQQDKNNNQERNIANNKRLAQTGVKGAATAAGAYLGGKAGAAIGSKVGDTINNSKVGQAATNIAGQAMDTANNIMPGGKTRQNALNKTAESGLPNAVDKGIDANTSIANKVPNVRGSINKEKPQQKSSLPKNERTNKNPTHSLQNIKAKHSKHSKNEEPTLKPDTDTKAQTAKNTQDKQKQENINNKDNNQKKNKENKGRGVSPLNRRTLGGLGTNIGKRLLNGKSKENTETEETEEEETHNIARGVKLVMATISSFIALLPVIGIGLLLVFVISFIPILLSLIQALLPYGQDEDGTVCFASATCTKVIIDGKEYAMDEYIAGAIVNYYPEEDLVTPLNQTVSQNLLQALSVIIHSDISTYSTYDSKNETCTVNSSSRFSEIYDYDETLDNNQDITDDGDDESTQEETNVSEPSNSDTNNTQEQTEEEKKEAKKREYYTQAKNAADSVIDTVVDIYSQNLDIFYDGYLDKLKEYPNVDYKTITRIYIFNSPDYEKPNKNGTDEEMTEDDIKEDSEENPIGIYPICYYEKPNTGSDTTLYYGDEVCNTVVITADTLSNHQKNGLDYSGEYSIDEFIEGVVYNEARDFKDSMDTLKAHAVAARTYLIGRADKIENDICYIAVDENTLGFTPNQYSEITQAVEETRGEYVMNGDEYVYTQWDALCTKGTSGSNYIICQQNQQVPISWFSTVTLYNTIDDYNKQSHGNGMSQYGAYYLATEENRDYKYILNYYYGGTVNKIASINKEGYTKPITSFSMITGEFTGYCGSGNAHSGIDFAAAAGTPVYAAHSGTIVKEYTYASNCYGHCSSTQGVGIGYKIDNGDGTYSMYMHFSKTAGFHTGDTVTAGEVIGYVGNTGSSTGNHLHYGMKDSSGNDINPRNYLPLDEEGVTKCYNYH